MLKHPPAEHDPATVGVRALGFLAADMDRLGRFLALTGIDPSTVRTAAREPGFLTGVLDHILSDDRLLAAFGEHAGLRPEDVERARSRLDPAQPPAS